MDTELPGYCNKGIHVPRILCHTTHAEVAKVAGKDMGIMRYFK